MNYGIDTLICLHLINRNKSTETPTRPAVSEIDKESELVETGSWNAE